MKTITPNIIENQTLIQLFHKPISNAAVIREERDGYGTDLSNHHLTEIKDTEVLRLIKQMSVLEVIT